MKTRLFYWITGISALMLAQACQPSGDSGVVENSGVEKTSKSQHLMALTTKTFQKEVLQSEQLVIVDFWAPWCPPCLELAPVVSKLADAYAGKVKVGKVDVAEEINKELMDKYVGEGIPLIVFFKGGKKVDESLGLVTEKELVEKIEKHR